MAKKKTSKKEVEVKTEPEKKMSNSERLLPHNLLNQLDSLEKSIAELDKKLEKLIKTK